VSPPDGPLAWAEEVLPDLLRSLAARVGGTTDATVRGGATAPFRGGFVHYTAAGRVSLRMWIHVSPAGAGGSVPGEPDAIYLQPDEGGKAGWRLRANFGGGFHSGPDIAGSDTWRTWVPVEKARAAGPPEAQVAFLTRAFAEALTAAGLLEPE
jgi:hypothetical protein